MIEEISSIAISPQGLLYLLNTSSAIVPDRIQAAFQESGESGLIQLGLLEVRTDLPPDLAYWRDFSRMYFTHLCAVPGLSEMDTKAPIELSVPRQELAQFATSAPPMVGAEYLNENILVHLWESVHLSFIHQLQDHHGTVQSYFETQGAVWNLVGRVCFHLAENKADEEAPFAFLATYSHRLSSQGKAQHLPLGRALQEYAGEKNKAQLLQLLLPVKKLAKIVHF